MCRPGYAWQNFTFTPPAGAHAVVWLVSQACGLPVDRPAITAVHPSIMVNLWPRASGTLRGVSGLDDLPVRAGRYLDDVVLYDEVGDWVDRGCGAERGIGHVAFRDAEVNECFRPAGIRGRFLRPRCGSPTST
jgi:hypothetical protein